MRNALIVMALEAEGQGRLEALGFEVVYSGIGKVNAAHCLMKRLADSSRPVERVLNLGSAGSHHFMTGEVIEVDRLVQRDMDLVGLGFPLGHTPFEEDPPQIQLARVFASLQAGICGTGDSFVIQKPQLHCELVDMEAYALAKICMREALPFHCVKYITDGADHAASDDWNTNLTRAADAFVELLS